MLEGEEKMKKDDVLDTAMEEIIGEIPKLTHIYQRH